MTSTEPQRLYLLQLSTATIPRPDGGTLEMSSGCYLVTLADGRHLLIDSGFPPDVPPPPQVPAGAEATTVIARLAELGLRPEHIDLLVCTHFDVDHVGYHDAFPRAELIVQREHYALARSGDPRFAAGRAHWDHPALRYRQVEGDTELLPGFTLIETSGHVLGHQSVLIRLPQTGPVLLAIDAVMLERFFTPDRPSSPLDADEERTRASTRKLLDLVEREHVVLVVFGHDGRQWRTLKRSPSFYE